jgi:hypothetical protein
MIAVIFDERIGHCCYVSKLNNKRLIRLP